jgi:hypothetical protein
MASDARTSLNVLAATVEAAFATSRGDAPEQVYEQIAAKLLSDSEGYPRTRRELRSMIEAMHRFQAPFN